ncbi:hypothetical protein [Nitrosomonas eutropha]|uniref:SPOR domain-containing protein n=2 Tax=Nitrosomonas eutropha TaxID=916 RepID=A0ABX5M962_9PROT|nr:hypothetical protein [Nitrosomonas eutropha]ABI58590.1 conserved hypothetical protein [Nitrosomonas eutropha C91]PXV79730.1 hypothetical protein C8R14_12249 [Nitrosomonas eutropha]SEJ02745.1 hypothetical protein SAMN05216318_1212 [Nitrosomonas eutropha]
MKKLLLFLLLANIGAAFYFYSLPKNNFSVQKPLIHPEKIELLPTKVACLKWGSLPEPVARLARAEISKWETRKDLVTEISQGKITIHWMHIPPLQNARETAKQIEQLEKLEIPHLHIQENADNPWHNAISLAILMDNSDAVALTEDMKNKGVEHVLDSEQTLEQFEFVVRSPTKQITENIQQLIRQFPGTQLEVSECDRL